MRIRATRDFFNSIGQRRRSRPVCQMSPDVGLPPDSGGIADFRQPLLGVTSRITRG